MKRGDSVSYGPKGGLKKISGMILAAFLMTAAVAFPVSAQYPDPLPNFAHPETPHYLLYSPYGGSLDRPVLVIIRHFKDYPPDPNRDSAWAAERFFGRDSLNIQSYFLSNSFNKLFLWPAPETEGTVNDGIVVVYSDITVADFYAMTTDEMRKTGIEAADSYVDFASFDTNPPDGIVTNEELLVFQIHPPLTNENCGQTAGTSVILPNGLQISLSVSQVSSLAGFLTFVHELAHPALNFVDFYGYYNARFDPCEATCGLPDNTVFSYNAYNKLHFGWISPTAVTRDGFYEIHDARETGEAFILYDYARGTDDYFVVENRRRGGYDEDIGDEGLVIWRIDEAVFASPDPNIKPINIMKPNAGNTSLAWDPSDPATPERTMKKPWRDGTPSRVAVRAIGPRGPVIQAYFDVRGPGVLVDPSTATGTPMRIEIKSGKTSLIEVPVMNTGEVADSFAFTIVGLPADWVVSTKYLNLDPKVPATASINVTVPAYVMGASIVAQAQGISTTDPSVHTLSPLTIVAKSDVDLFVRLTHDPLFPSVGQAVDVTVSVENNGAFGDAGNFSIDFYKHSEVAPPTYVAGDFSCSPQSLPHGTSTRCSSRVYYDSPGTYKMWARADRTNQVFEVSESNNLLQQDIIISTTGALSVEPAGAFMSSGLQGGPFTPSSKKYTLKNTGGSSIDWRVWHLRGWITVSPEDGRLGPGGSTDVSVSINSYANSLTPGTHTDAINFQNTTNGEGNTTRPTTLTVKMPDLIETLVGNPPAAASAGKSIAVKDKVWNQGTGKAGASTTRYYLSLDQTWGVEDKLLKGSRAVPYLPPGATSIYTVNVTIPSTTVGGTYYLLACADDLKVVDELDETNNCKASSTTVVVDTVDLVETSVSDPPAISSPGVTFAVTDTTENQGTRSTGGYASETQYYLFNKAKAERVRLKGARYVPPLEPGAPSTGTENVTIPLTTAPATYFLLACADGTNNVVESNESNNCLAAGNTVEVRGKGPDLVETSVSDPPTTSLPGDTIAVTDTAENQGTGSAKASMTGYYLSPVITKPKGDVRLKGKRSVPTLAPGAASAETVNVTIPATIAIGTYYLLACSDDTELVVETNENNNCIASGNTVEIKGPDLAETSVSNPPVKARLTGSFSVMDTVKNQGNDVCGASTTRYYLSLNTKKGTEDKLLDGIRSVPGLAVGGISTGKATTVTIPKTTVPGTYYLLACADDLDVVGELKEANNCKASVTTVAVSP